MDRQDESLDPASFADAVAPLLECLANVMSTAGKDFQRTDLGRYAWWARACDDAAHLAQDVRNVQEGS
jgi:hypothetical protein